PSSSLLPILGRKPYGKIAKPVVVTSKPQISPRMKKILLFILALFSPMFMALAQTLSNYQSNVMNQSPNYYFTFDTGSLTSVTNNVTLLSSPASFTQLAFDVFGNPSDSVFFSAQGDALVGTGDGLI